MKDDLFWAQYMGLRSLLTPRKPAEAAIEALHRIADGKPPYRIYKTTVNPWFEHGKNKYRWIERSDDIGADVSYCDQVHGCRLINHRGWFVDDCFDEVFRGVVLTVEDCYYGKHYLWGYECPNNSNTYCIENGVTTDIEEAARWADRMAERFAEDEREYREKECQEEAAEAAE